MRLLLVVLAFTAACANVAPRSAPKQSSGRQASAHREREHRPPREIDAARIHIAELDFAGSDFAYVDGNTGAQLSFDEVLTRARRAQVVVVGEQHDQAAHHELERRMVASLGQDGAGLAVGLEMLTWDHQGALDQFNGGEIDADVLDEIVDWPHAWGFPYAMYQPIFVDGHRLGAQFVALNAPRELVRGVRKRGLDGLSLEEVQQLPDVDLSDRVHRQWFEDVFKEGQHPISQADLDGFYTAQVVWDESIGIL